MSFSINTSTLNQEMSTDDIFASGILGKEILLDVEYFDNADAVEEHSVNPDECDFAIRVAPAIESYLMGSNCGVWIDPSSYNTRNDFMEACAAVLGAEEKPQFEFVASKGVPKHFMTVTSVDCDLWPHMAAWNDLDDAMRGVVTLYWEYQYDGSTTSIEKIRDAYIGSFNGAGELGLHLLYESGQLDHVPENLRPYFDFESYAGDAMLGGDLWWIQCGTELHAFWPCR